jgi:hypothetical protein
MDSMDFYTTGAQVIPVLIFAVVWESRYLEELERKRRGGGFWRRGSHKGFGRAHASAGEPDLSWPPRLSARALMVLVLADVPVDGWFAKVSALLGMFALMGSLTTRVLVAADKATACQGDTQAQSAAGSCKRPPP